MPAGYGDLLQAVQNPGPVVDVADGDAGHAHDAVHGGADVVAHPGEEVALGGVGVVGGLIGVQKGLPLPGLLLLALRHVLGGVEDGAGPPPAVAADQHRRGTGPAALVRRDVLAGDGQLAVLNGQKGPVPAQAAAEILDGHGV